MKKIVLIEDNDDVRETTQEMLELADYEVITAENGKIGVEKVKVHKPDLVICDIMMPELDGYGVLRILSKNPETYHIPFIFLTAKAEKEEMRKGMNLGADDYVTKPFEDTELLEAVEMRINRSEKLKTEFSGDMVGLDAFFNEARGIEELNNLSQNRKIKSYRDKEVIYREDDYANYLYFIVKGKVKCVKTDDYDKNFIYDIFNEGDFIGYVTLFDGAEYHETAIALGPTEVAVIPKEDFLSLLHKDRDVATRFIKMLSGNVQDRETRLLQLAYATVKERVAHALLKLTSNPVSEHGMLKLSREDLANMVGTAKESLIRTLSDMKKEGLVHTEGKLIEIRDEKGLKRIIGDF